MNILLDYLPETIEVDGKEYFADTDFRTFIILEKIINDASLSSSDAVLSVIDLVLPQEQPPIDAVEETVRGIMDLYSCGSPSRGKKKRRMNGNVVIKDQMIYDYEYDAPYIYGAFLSQYGIDLNAIEYLHWWKFVALFKSLPSDCKICEIMSYRATDLAKIKDREEKNRIARLKEIYALPNNMTFEDKVAAAGAAFGGAFMK